MKVISDILFSFQDIKYRAFTSKLIPNIDREKIIGVRTPKLRSIAKELFDFERFLSVLPHTYLEENHLHAFLIERETDFDLCIQKLNTFLPYVDNWATCDSMNPKVLGTAPDKLIKNIPTWIASSDTYTVRFAILLLMRYYLDKNFNETLFGLVEEIRREEYYINMMRAWFFATALAKQYEIAVRVLENRRLDVWTHNKTIQKAVESNRITALQKTYLKTLKVKD